MNVSACLVTRGDVDMSQIIESITAAGIEDIVLWDNSKRHDLSVYGRYAAIDEAQHDLIYVQDDDCLHTPEGVTEMVRFAQYYEPPIPDAIPAVVCNMPQAFRHSFYEQHSLVGFGACFQRDLPRQAFRRFIAAHWPGIQPSLYDPPGSVFLDLARRTCDIVFTAFTPRVLVDVLYEDLPWASAPNRMWQQPTHREERQQMLNLCLRVRDAA